jgi:3-deoxy-D-manno-octulosonate 8-phosphate phosphatase (KDO 8-P phosphatase)
MLKDIALALTEKAQDITTFFLDVDGVLTDGSLYFDAQGETLKKFSTLDGHGLKLLKRAHITPVVITGRDSQALRQRLSDLGIEHAYFGVENKKAVADAYLQMQAQHWHNVAAMGDDWPDLPVLIAAQCSFAPPSAHAEIINRVNHVCSAFAGRGAVREACDVLLMAKGVYELALKEALS